MALRKRREPPPPKKKPGRRLIGVSRLTITLPSQLTQEVRRWADMHAGGNISAWIAEACRREIGHEQRQEALGELLRYLEQEHGPLTPEEEAAADAQWAERIAEAEERARTRAERYAE